MTASRIDGKAAAERIRKAVASDVAAMKKTHGVTPGLAVIIAGEDPASQIYVRNKVRQTAETGMNGFHYELAADTPEPALLERVAELNADDAVDGILVQLPLPPHIDEAKILAAIDPAKDVDGFHILNAGLLATGGDALVPCTPLGCLLLLKETLGDLSGLDAVVIGRSNIVGKPMAQLLLKENCTVTIAHSKTKNLPDVVRRADIVVAAVGRAKMVKGDWIKPGATVIDVGINRIPAPDLGEGKSRVAGDVDTAAASERAAYITPVPGGVGPMTIACLLRNTVTAAKRRRGL